MDESGLVDDASRRSKRRLDRWECGARWLSPTTRFPPSAQLLVILVDEGARKVDDVADRQAARYWVYERSGNGATLCVRSPDPGDMGGGQQVVALTVSTSSARLRRRVLNGSGTDTSTVPRISRANSDSPASAMRAAR